MLLHRLVRGGVAELFGKKFLISVVVTDPIPEERFVFEDGEGSTAGANANRPDRTALLKAQGRVPRVSLPKPICRTCPALDIRRERAIRGPEVTRCR